MGMTLKSNGRLMSRGKARDAIADEPTRIQAGRLPVRRRSNVGQRQQRDHRQLTDLAPRVEGDEGRYQARARDAPVAQR